MGQYEGAFHHWMGWMKVGWKSQAAILSEIKEKKGKEAIEAIVIDHAVSQDFNVGFSHWKGRVEGVKGDEASINAREMEGMSVFIFDEEGKIIDVWTLKSPNPEDKEKMRQTCIALTSKMSRIEWT